MVVVVVMFGGLVVWLLGRSVAARQLREVDDKPSVGREIEELDFTKEGEGDWLKREAPGVWVGAEFEARKEQAEPVFRSGPRKSGEILDAMRGG